MVPVLIKTVAACPVSLTQIRSNPHAGDLGHNDPIVAKAAHMHTCCRVGMNPPTAERVPVVAMEGAQLLGAHPRI